jgi:hypothetical protein
LARYLIDDRVYINRANAMSKINIAKRYERDAFKIPLRCTQKTAQKNDQRTSIKTNTKPGQNKKDRHKLI